VVSIEGRGVRGNRRFPGVPVKGAGSKGRGVRGNRRFPGVPGVPVKSINLSSHNSIKNRQVKYVFDK